MTFSMRPAGPKLILRKLYKLEYQADEVEIV